MKKNPEISIIVPVFNREMFLNKCVDSILKQTFIDFELILVDDGSTDNSAEICKSYAEKDARAIYIYQQNKGVSAARNTGLDNAKGNYIGWVDSDDWVAEDMFEHLYNLIKLSNADIAECRHYYVMKDKTEIHGFESITEDSSDTAMLEFYIQHQLSESLCTKLFKRHLFENYRFPVGQVFEDMRCILYICTRFPKYVRSNGAKYYYRQTTNSIITAPLNIARAITNINLLKDLIEIINNAQDIDSPLKKKAIKAVLEQSIGRYLEMKMSNDEQIRNKYAKIYKKIAKFIFWEILSSKYIKGRLKMLYLIDFFGFGRILKPLKSVIN